MQAAAPHLAGQHLPGQLLKLRRVYVLMLCACWTSLLLEMRLARAASPDRQVPEALQTSPPWRRDHDQRVHAAPDTTPLSTQHTLSHPGLVADFDATQHPLANPALASISRPAPDRTDAVEPHIASSAVIGRSISTSEHADRLRLFRTDSSRSLSGHVHGMPDVVTGGAHLRGLLHGSRARVAYSKCPLCLIIGCGGSPFRCSGHCRSQGIFYECFSGAPRANISCPEIDESDTTPPAVDALGEYDALQLTATAPYMACANVTNRDTGCPQPLTRARVGPRGNSVNAWVRESRCMTTEYVAQCARVVGRRPYNPYGYCECVMEVSGVGQIVQPCNVSELLLSFGRGSALTSNQSDILVEERGNVTRTAFSVFDEEFDRPALQFNTTFETVTGDEVNVTLDFIFGEVVETEEIEVEAVLELGNMSDSSGVAEAPEAAGLQL